LPPSFEQQIEKLKLEFQAAKTDAEKMRLEIQRTKLLKEAQEVKSNIRKEIIEVLKELHAPNHPADNVIHGNKG
jgi:hypothetical protein